MRALTTIAIAVLVLALDAQTVTTIETRPDGIWLVFSNTPAHWTLEQTEDLFTWNHMLTGSMTNWLIEIRVRSRMEAMFYRVREVQQ
jgi:hypothetical protein